MTTRSKIINATVVLAMGLAAAMIASREKSPGPAATPEAEKSAPEIAVVIGSTSHLVSAATVTHALKPLEDDESATDEKVALLKRILDSKDDNDPRLDSDFREMSARLKNKLRKFYGELASENLNSRGMLVFLLGREIRSAEDAEFMSEVLQDPPCKSLDNCRRDDVREPLFENLEHESEVTLAYPQIIASVSLAKNWPAIAGLSVREELERSLRQASESPNAALARSARAALHASSKYGQGH